MVSRSTLGARAGIPARLLSVTYDRPVIIRLNYAKTRPIAAVNLKLSVLDEKTGKNAEFLIFDFAPKKTDFQMHILKLCVVDRSGRRSVAIGAPGRGRRRRRCPPPPVRG